METWGVPRPSNGVDLFALPKRVTCQGHRRTFGRLSEYGIWNSSKYFNKCSNEGCSKDEYQRAGLKSSSVWTCVSLQIRYTSRTWFLTFFFFFFGSTREWAYNKHLPSIGGSHHVMFVKSKPGVSTASSSRPHPLSIIKTSTRPLHFFEAFQDKDESSSGFHE